MHLTLPLWFQKINVSLSFFEMRMKTNIIRYIRRESLKKIRFEVLVLPQQSSITKIRSYGTLSYSII